MHLSLTPGNQKTTPAAARQILNDRPPIACALITLMVSMNAINFDVFQVIVTHPE
jgi:cleavage stimulation factor subunit 2